MVDTSIIGGRLQRLGYKRYDEYLASEHWQDVRKRFKESSEPQRCKCGKARQALHHKTYKRLGEERLTDLEAVCHDCHKKRHAKKPKKAPQSQHAKASRKKQKRRRQHGQKNVRRAHKRWLERESAAERRQRLAREALSGTVEDPNA